jgi:hypothetical protein
VLPPKPPGSDRDTAKVAVLLGLLCLVLLTFSVLHAELFYGDWHCAFAECRIEKGK